MELQALESDHPPLPQTVLDALAAHLAAHPTEPRPPHVHDVGQADHPVGVRAQVARRGADRGVTLDTSSHLWPDSDDRTRDAIDSVLGSTADALRTEAAPTS